MKIDLHCHSNRSDGAHPPAEVVRTARREGVDVLALTDHDCLAGIPEARAEAERAGLRIVGGVELTTHRDGEDIHVLGLFADPGNAVLDRHLEARRAERRDRVRGMVERLARRGIRLDADEILRSVPADSVGRPHVAQALVRARAVGSVDEAFDRFLGHGREGYVPSRAQDPAEGVRLLLEAGAVPVLAHPVVYRGARLVPSLAEAGLVGLEVYHPDQEGRAEEFLRLARAHGLVPSGGSDFHGHSKERYSAPGRYTCPPDSFALLEARAKEAA